MFLVVINVSNNDFLDWWDNAAPSQHTVFGQITSGIDTVVQISKVQVDVGDSPITPVKVRLCTAVNLSTPSRYWRR